MIISAEGEASGNKLLYGLDSTPDASPVPISLYLVRLHHLSTLIFKIPRRKESSPPDCLKFKINSAIHTSANQYLGSILAINLPLEANSGTGEASAIKLSFNQTLQADASPCANLETIHQKRNLIF